MNPKRIDYVDIARGIAILSVIAYHTGFLPFQHQLLPLITPWMLPVFAVLHGMIAGGNYSPGQVLLRRIRSLLVPYLLYGLSTYALWLVLRMYAPGSVLFASWQEGLHQFATGTGLIYNGPLWFLPSFFLAAIMFAIVRRLILPINKLGLLFTAHVLVVVSFMINPSGTKLVFSYDLAFLFAACMVMGSWLSATRWEQVPKLAWYMLAGGFMALVWYNGTVDIFGRVFHQPAVYWITALTGSILVIRAAKGMAGLSGFIHDALVYVGKYSMILLCTHWPIMQWLTFLLTVLGVLGALSGTPTYTSFSYYHPDAVIFTLIELPLLALYFLVPIGALWLYRSLRKLY